MSELVIFAGTSIAIVLVMIIKNYLKQHVHLIMLIILMLVVHQKVLHLGCFLLIFQRAAVVYQD
jgi:hypothetical protein